eukprot:532062_1
MGQKSSNLLEELNDELLETARKFDGSILLPKHQETILLINGYIRETNDILLDIASIVDKYYFVTYRQTISSELIHTGNLSSTGILKVAKDPSNNNKFMLMFWKENKMNELHTTKSKKKKSIRNQMCSETRRYLNELNILQQLDNKYIANCHRAFVNE